MLKQLEQVIPGEEPEGDFIQFYAQINMVAIPAAMAISYARNRDPAWAVFHGLFALPYVMFVVADILGRKEGELLWRSTQPGQAPPAAYTST